MAVFMKQGGQWLYDHSTSDIVGVKKGGCHER
jgi:hypothetical protein